MFIHWITIPVGTFHSVWAWIYETLLWSVWCRFGRIIGFSLSWKFILKSKHTNNSDTGRESTKIICERKSADDGTATRHDYLLWLKCIRFYTTKSFVPCLIKNPIYDGSFYISHFPSVFSLSLYIILMSLCWCEWMCLEYWWYVIVYSSNLFIHNAKPTHWIVKKDENTTDVNDIKNHSDAQTRYNLEHIAFKHEIKTNVCL